MNVLIAVPWDQETGGVASVVGHLALQLQEHGHQVHFLHPASSRVARAKITKWGFPGYEVNLRSPTSPPTLRARIAYAMTFPATCFALSRILRRHQIDVVNVHYPSAMFGYFALLRRLRPGSRLVVSLHGADVVDPPDRVGVDAITARLLGTADAIVTPSGGFTRQCRPLLHPLESVVHVIHNGVSLAEFDGVSGDRQPETLLSIASLDSWKGLDVLIRAVAELRRERSELRLLIAGDGPERAALGELVTALGQDGAVAFLGQVSRARLMDLLSTCTLFVHPSRFEPFGIAVAEALAAGVPAVATNVGGIPEILGDGDYGLLVPPDSVAALVSAISRLLKDAGLRHQLAASGPPRVAAAFRWEFTGQRYLSLFQRLLHSGNRTE